MNKTVIYHLAKTYLEQQATKKVVDKHLYEIGYTVSYNQDLENSYKDLNNWDKFSKGFNQDWLLGYLYGVLEKTKLD